MVPKNYNVNKPLYYAKLVFKKDKCLSVENTLDVEVWQTHFRHTHFKELTLGQLPWRKIATLPQN